MGTWEVEKCHGPVDGVPDGVSKSVEKEHVLSDHVLVVVCEAPCERTDG